MCCYGCELRTVGCHAKCSMYQTVYEENLKRYSEKEKQSRLNMDLSSVKGNSIKRMCRRDNRYYK